MALSRIFPIGYDDEDVWGGLAHDMQRLNQQMRRMNQNFGGFQNPAQLGSDIARNEMFRMDNPIIKDKDGNQKFHLEFDLRQFKPEEIELTTKDNVLSVHAKHEEKSEGRASYREYRRSYALPPGVSAESLASKLAHNGVLSIEAPVQPKQDTKIAITHK